MQGDSITKPKRRGKGDGGVGYREEIGLYYAYMTLPNGKKRWFYARTRVDAIRKKDAARELQLRHGEVADLDVAKLGRSVPGSPQPLGLHRGRV